MKIQNCLFVLLALILLLGLTESSILKGRALSQMCCSQCMESKMMSTIFSPNRLVNSVYQYTGRRMPAMFFSALFKYIPAEFTQSVVEVMEELSFRQEEKMVTCKGSKLDSHSGYFKDFSNITINVFF